MDGIALRTPAVAVLPFAAWVLAAARAEHFLIALIVGPCSRSTYRPTA
jgi:hypothetical protein